MSDLREITQSPIAQGKDERIAYTVTTTPWGSSPSAVVVAVIDQSTGQDVTASTTTGTASVVGDVITLPILHSLTARRLYRVEVRFVTGGATLECYALVRCQE